MSIAVDCFCLAVIHNSIGYAVACSLFIPLQDTTASMGQTGICPGTHYCTSVQDFEIGCKQIVSGKRRDNNQMLWLAGDAVLMNQNTFHRGTKHTDKKGGDRVIIVITFTSRPRFPYGKIQQQRPLSAPLPSKLSSKQTKRPNGNRTISSVDAKNFPIQSWEDEIKKNMYPESRVLSLGTPLTSFGHTLYDMKDSPSSKSTVLNFLRYFGIYKSPEARWGWSYINSVFSRISAESHKFKREDLSGWLSSQKNFIKRNRNSPRYALRFRSQITEWYLRNVILGRVPPEKNEKYGVYDVFILFSLTKVSSFCEFRCNFWIDLTLRSVRDRYAKKTIFSSRTLLVITFTNTRSFFLLGIELLSVNILFESRSYGLI